MFGRFEGFPDNIHLIEIFSSKLSHKRLQLRLIEILQELNKQEYSFEQISIPTVPECKIIFDIGIAESEDFNYIDRDEEKKLTEATKRRYLSGIDLYLAIRYYKINKNKRTPLKFDYYMIRISFKKDRELEIRVFHERGPRYLTPEDLVNALIKKINKKASRKILKRISPD
jgi:hypothetical protein